MTKNIKTVSAAAPVGAGKPKTSREYVVTSRPGMTPYATVTSRREADRLARRAQKLGLDGRVRVYRDGVDVTRTSDEESD